MKEIGIGRVDFFGVKMVKEPEAKNFSKNDMERMGVFSEMGYISIGDPYKGVSFNQAASKGKQFMIDGSKNKSAQQHGYFDLEFNRVMTGEAYSDPVRGRRLMRKKAHELDIGKPFLPSNGYKMMSGLGTYYGTIGGSMAYFNPGMRALKDKIPIGKNVLTNPSKKGTGYGYANVTINTYQTHATEDYDKIKKLAKSEQDAHRTALKGGAFKPTLAPQRFFSENPYRTEIPLGPLKKSGTTPNVQTSPFKPSSPAKKPGGNMSGTFDPYPKHSDGIQKKANLARAVHVVNNTGRIFMPNTFGKTAPVFSTLAINVDRKVNKKNYRSINKVMSF